MRTRGNDQGSRIRSPEIQQREPAAEAIEYRRAILKKYVRRAHPRPGAGHVVQLVPGRLPALVTDDRRSAVAVAELDPEGLVLVIAQLEDAPAQRLSCRRSLCAVLMNERGVFSGYLEADRHVCFGRLAIRKGHRTPLGIDTGEQVGPTPTLQDRSELPGEIDAITNTRVH